MEWASCAQARQLCGVYVILNRVTGHRYIGRSVRVGARLYQHRRHLRAGDHTNHYLQAAFQKYGERAFEFRLLVVCSLDMTPFYEALLVGGYRSDNPETGYNLTIAVDGNLRHTSESRVKIAEAGIGRPCPKSPEHREKLAAALRGRVGLNKGKEWTLEQRAKMGAPKGSRNRAGKTFTCEQRAKIAAGVSAYYAANPEARAAAGDRRRGKPGPNAGRKFPPEVRARMSASKKGRMRRRAVDKTQGDLDLIGG